MNNNTYDKEILKQKLLKILLNKFQKEYEANKKYNLPILIIRIYDYEYGFPEEGYNEIYEAKRMGIFDEIKEEYFMYISGSQIFLTKDSYYEITWEFRKYFSTLWHNQEENMKLHLFLQ